MADHEAVERRAQLVDALRRLLVGEERGHVRAPGAEGLEGVEIEKEVHHFVGAASDSSPGSMQAVWQLVKLTGWSSESGVRSASDNSSVCTSRIHEISGWLYSWHSIAEWKIWRTWLGPAAAPSRWRSEEKWLSIVASRGRVSVGWFES